MRINHARPRRLSRDLLVLFIVASGIILSGCGGGSSPALVISVSVSPSAPQTIDQGQTIKFTAAVTNDQSSKGVTWSQTGQGALSGHTAGAVTYTSPSGGAAGSATVTATSVADPTKTATVNVSITLPPSITTTTLPAATMGSAYGQKISVTGGAGTLTYSISSGTLPKGLTLNGNTISGTPTGSAGTASFTVKVTDSSTVGATSATQPLSITVNPATGTLNITTTTLPNGVLGSLYSAMLQSTGGLAPISWSIIGGAALPTGLSLNSSTGAITGTPTAAGTVNLTFQAADSSSPQQTAKATLSIAVNPALNITTTALPNGSRGGSYSATLQSSGGLGAISWSVIGALPAGLNLNSTGEITGTPTTAGTTSITFQAADSSSPEQTAKATLSLTIVQLTITTASLLNPMVGEAYNQTLQYEDNGGTLPVTWSLASGTLPTGFNLDPSSGAITGTATAGEVGTTTFTVQVTDSSAPPQTAMQALSLTITTATACGSGSESFLSGQYAMSLTGFDASGPIGMLASFTADGTGNVTGGVEDINSSGPGGVQANVPITPTGSSYSIGADHRGCLTLVTSLGTKVFRIAVGVLTGGVASSGRSIEFDATGTNVAGSFQIQQPSAFSNAQVTGNFAFIVSTPLTAAAGGGFFAAVGALNLSGTNVTGVGDMNFNGIMDPGNASYPSAPMSFTGGTYNIGSNGRGTLSFTVSISGTPTTINLFVYVLNAGQMYLMSSAPQTASNNLFSGFAGRQTGVPYANSSLAVPSVLFASGQTAPGAPASRVETGIFTPDGAGNFTFAGDMNSGGAVSTVSESGTYSVAANGRALLTNTGGASPAQVMYLVLSNWGYALSTDGNVMIGDSEPQSGLPFTDATLNGTFSFGTIVPVVPGSPLTAGEATYDGAGNVSITFDVNEGGFLSINNVITATYAASPTGRVVTPAGGTTLTVGYITFSGTVITFGLTSTDTNPTLRVMEQ
jgi:large repetitive protein